MAPQRTSGFEIRPAAERDANGILDCLAAAFEPYRVAYTAGASADTVLDPASLRQRMSGMTVFVAEMENHIIGTIASSAQKPTGHLRGMAVLPGRQGTGVAGALLAAAEDYLRQSGCTRVTLDTTEPLQRAIRFYTRHGYAATGHITDFFGMRLHEYTKAL
ncbi:MAG TPA: GNAT family N-acetyltransferase [Acidobacteriaceae bacterium]|nr:GNAT family N-acetyltransferase [Acidobacteriaceae bacterium]